VRCVAAATPPPLASVDAPAASNVPETILTAVCCLAWTERSGAQRAARQGVQCVDGHMSTIMQHGVGGVPAAAVVKARVTRGKRLTPGTEGGGSPVPPVCTMGGPNRGRWGLNFPPGCRCEPKTGAASGRRRLRLGEPPAQGMDKRRLGSKGAAPQDVRPPVRICTQ